MDLQDQKNLKGPEVKKKIQGNMAVLTAILEKNRRFSG
jgi:hypothetical protein